MQRALKEIVVPRIRSMGFVGSFPHFRRKVATEYQVLMVGFDKYGGSFYASSGKKLSLGWK